MKISSSHKLVSQIAGIFILASVAGADLWNIQFSRNLNSPVVQTGAAVIGDAGDMWNFCLGSSGTNAALYNAAGSATSVSITWTARGALNAPDTDGSFGFYGTPYANLMRGCLYNKSGETNTLTIAGLAASSEYAIYLYTQGDSACSGRQLTATTDDGSFSSSAAVATASSFVLNQNYLLFTSTTDASGVLNISYHSLSEADVNGLQIIAIPEPATAGLFGLSCAAVFVVLRIKKYMNYYRQ